jgi:hypothetical protein
VARDLGKDPYLPYILVLAAVLAGFWFWHLIPNFATQDERDRLFDPLVALGTVLEEPSFESLREGITYGRTAFGATFYLFGLALVPVVLAALVMGQLDVFLAFDDPNPAFRNWVPWYETPRWIWTGNLLLVRLFNVAFAVGCVYLTYRIGVMLRDRATGRLAALLLTFTWGFLALAHEAGEDIPAVFFTLLTLTLALQYVRTGEGAPYLVGCAAGGVAITFKLTAAPVVLVLGVAYLLRTGEADDRRAALLRPRLLAAGMAVGAVTIVLGFPSALVAGFDPLRERLLGESAARMSSGTGPDAPIWWWFLRQYFNGLGLPLFVASVGAVLAGIAGLLPRPRERATNTGGVALLLVTIGAYLLMFSQWQDFRTHHLLPTFPLLVVVLAAGIMRWRGRAPRAANVTIAFLLVTSGTYAVAGDLGYATEPRDQAVSWLNENAPANATMEVTRRSFQDAAVPHWMEIRHFSGGGSAAGTDDVCPTYIQVGYRDLLYLKEDSYYRSGEDRREYFRSLLGGEYNYEIAVEFGQRPPNFIPQRPTPGSLVDLLWVGLIPRTDQYADEQETGPNQYTAILERTGPCDRSRDPPF